MSSEQQQRWNPILLTYLRTTTRELKFDWNAVAEQVRLFASREQYLEAISITPATCRELFASDYTQFEKVLPAPTEVVTAPVIAKSAVDIMQEYENMSYDELMEHVQTKEENMKQRKEQIFSQVLSSLGGVTGYDSSAATATMGAMLGMEYDQTRQAYSDNLAAKEAERLKKIALAEEQAERQRLDKERDSLKKRFEAGSADGVGEDPLAKSSFKYGDSANINYAGDKTTSDLDFIDSLPYDPNVTQALQNYMETDEFDVMLTELEKEIDAMAPGKDAGEAPSELSEILKALEVAAASKNEHTQSKRAAPQSGLLTAPVYAEKPAPVQPTIKVAFATAGEKGPAIERNSKMGADYLIPATAAALVPSNKAVANAAPVMRENAYDRSRRGGGGRGGAASSVASAGVESKAAAEDSDGEASKTADGDGSSDSDEDWRSMRNRQKKTADRSTCASGSGSTAAHNSSTASGFWGAHGAPTTARVRENPVEVPLAGDSEDPRFNAFVAEYAAAHNVRFAESESEESDADDGDKREADVVVVSNGIGKSIALDDEAQEVDEDVTGVAATSAPSSPIREATAPTSREEPPQYMPMPPVPPVSPPKAPLLVSVPLSAQLPPAPVQALSGSLGAAAGRRPRGKAGSIMTAGKSRKPTEAAPQETAEETGAEAEPPSTSVDATAPTQLAVEHAALPAEPASTLVESAAETAPSTVVDEAALAVEEAARVAAERAAAVLKAMSLDLLHAAVLSPLPCAYVSNKSSGTTVEFPIGTLPSKLSSHGTAVDRLVLVDVDLARLRSADVTSCGDSSWVSVVAWVLQASGDKYGLLALQHGLVSTNGVELSVCRMVLETASEKFSAAELMEVAKATLLASVLSDKSAAAVPLVDDTINTVPAVSVADVLNIRDSYAAPLMADLEFFSAPLSYKAHLPHLCLTGNSLGGGVAGCSAATGMVSVRDVAVCAIKSHVLSSQHLNTHTAGASVGAVLSALVSKAERAGLRLCGMRLAHLNALELFEYEHFCSVPGYSRPVPPTTVTHASTSAYNQHVLPVLCLAFHSCNVSASDACSSTNKTGTTSVTNVAASVLRTLLGPDDPSLARKTDPTSLRALFGTSKEHNLVYPIPHSADRLFKETSFWFGGRAAVTSVSKNVTLLCVESPRTARIGVRLQIARSSINASSAARLSALQSAVLVAVSESMGAVGQLTALSSHTSTAAYRSAMKTSSVRNISSSVVTSDDAYSAEGGVASQCFVWEFCTHVGDLFLDQCVAGLLSRTSNVVAEDSWTLAADWSAGRGEANISATTEDINEVLSPDVLSGSKLLALDMLKKVSEDDCKSHEDVGLADVVALSIGDESTAAAAEPLLPVLVSVLGLLPRTCDTTVLAVKAQRNGAGMLALLRGYQIIENMDHAISEMQRIMSGNSSPGRPLQQKTSVAQSKAKFDTTESIHSLCYTVKAFKGKRALELIFTEFPTSSLFMDLALRDLHTYVPLPSLQRCGFTWLEQVAHSTAQFTAATGTSCMDSLISAPAQYLQALFPPGVFTAVGAIFVPWLPDSASFTRNLARVLTRLEKEHFEIIEIKAVAAVSEALVRQLYTENLSEYAPNTRGSGIAAPSSVKHVDTTSAVVAALKGLSVFAILVRRRSALLHLKSLIGPVFSSELAEAQYPRSLVCLLSSLGSSGSIVNTKSSASVDPIVPLILPTLSCSSALCVLEEVFHHFYASFDAQQAAVSLNLPSSGGAHAEHAHAADSANIEHLTEASVGTGMVAGELLRVPMNERLNSAGVASIATAEVELKSDIKKAGGEVDTLRKQVDMAGIVITHALLQEVGVGVILESLHREGLMIRNAYTTHLTSPAIKQLQQLAGASSLSMKPTTSLLSAAPVLVLGLEGPSHSFVRFKSYSTVARSAVQLWRLTSIGSGVGGGSSGANDAVSSTANDAGAQVDWGVLASSSSRLAKDLYKHCFDKIFGDDSAFAIQ